MLKILKFKDFFLSNQKASLNFNPFITPLYKQTILFISNIVDNLFRTVEIFFYFN